MTRSIITGLTAGSGTNATLGRLSTAIHERGFRLILDGVFNHVGRDFWAFKDVLRLGEGSVYRNWFSNLTFGKNGPLGDPFSYDGWNGHYNLVKLNLGNPEVREHLLGAVGAWVRKYGIDGLRLDAADVMDIGFLKVLSSYCRRLHPDFWLMGEVVHGDYRRWANPETLDSVTNYECYKGLYSSHNDRNYFEIAYSLNRQFGKEGIYRGLPLYSFADNHDVDRVASRLKNTRHIAPLYYLLFTMPGVPSIYYGSEWGIEGKKDGTDRPLRPWLDLNRQQGAIPRRELVGLISRLARVRRANIALRDGDYSQLHVSSQQLAFKRRAPSQDIAVVVNSAERPARLDLDLPGIRGSRLVDLLDTDRVFPIRGEKVTLDPLEAFTGRILEAR